MTQTDAQNLIKQALVLETQHRTAFLEKIDDEELKKKIEFLLQDDKALTHFSLKTSAAHTALDAIVVKDLQAGDRINQFVIKKMIAKGGMGSVYLAYDKKLKRNVAIKTIRAEYLKNQVTQQRFKQEAQILSQINHPAICQIYDYIDFENFDVLVLELVEGTTLNQVELSDKQKLDIFIKIASALVAAHNKDIIHRDLKPDNIMITKEGGIKILDFGIAKSTLLDDGDSVSLEQADEKSLRPVTKMGTMMGTLLYMSPEQAQGHAVTAASDMYSLGIIMQEMLTGVAVYDLHSTKELKRQVVNAHRINTDLIPKHYKNIVDMLTHRSPEKRPDALTISQKLKVIQQQPEKKKRTLKNFAIVLIVISIAIFSYNQWRVSTAQSEKLNAIYQFKNEINTLANTYEKVYTLPLHDTSKDLQKLQLKKQSILSIINQNKALGQNDKALLIGQLYYSNKEYAQALPLLERAWTNLQLKPDAKKQLATMLSHVNWALYYQDSQDFFYQEGVQAGDEYKKIEKKYIPKAKYYQLYSDLSEDKSSIPQALLAWYDKNFDKALAILQDIIDNQDWQFEAYQYKGEILKSLGKGLYDKGELDKTIEIWTQAKQVFIDATLRGRSYQQAYKQVCILDMSLLDDAISRTGKSSADFYIEGVDYCNKALKIKSDDVEVYDNLINLNNLKAYEMISTGKNPDKYLTKVIELTEYSNKIKKSYRNVFSQGVAYSYWGEYQTSVGINPLNNYQKSINAYQQAGEMVKNTSTDIITNIMSVYLSKMDYQVRVGINPDDDLMQLLKFYDKSNNAMKYGNGYQLLNNFILAYAYGYQAKYDLLLDKNPLPLLKEAEKYIARAKKFSDKDPRGDYIVTDIYITQIQYQLEHSNYSEKYLKLAQSQNNKLLATTGKDSDYIEQQALLLMISELFHQRQNSTSKLNFTQAIETFNQAISLNPKSDHIYYNLAKLYWYKAQYEQKEDKQNAINQALNTCEKGLLVNANNAFIYALKAKLLRQSQMQNAKQEAQKWQNKAESINPLLKNTHAIY